MISAQVTLKTTSSQMTLTITSAQMTLTTTSAQGIQYSRPIQVTNNCPSQLNNQIHFMTANQPRPL